MFRSGLLLSLAVAAAINAQQFEVATVKSSPPPAGDLININLGTVRNGKVTLTNASLSDCLKFAYGIVADAQISGPDWIKSKAVRFDIVAQASPDTPRDRLQLMLQALLAERLKLVLHREQKEFSYIALVPGKNRSKLREAKPDAVLSANNMAGPGHILSNQMTMERLAILLTRFDRETVLDQTGLKGQFEIKLEWAPAESKPGANNDIPSGPSIFTAVQEQLGLKLESRKGPLDVLVIDHAEQTPAEN